MDHEITKNLASGDIFTLQVKEDGRVVFDNPKEPPSFFMIDSGGCIDLPNTDPAELAKLKQLPEDHPPEESVSIKLPLKIDEGKFGQVYEKPISAPIGGVIGIVRPETDGDHVSVATETEYPAADEISNVKPSLRVMRGSNSNPNFMAKLTGASKSIQLTSNGVDLMPGFIKGRVQLNLAVDPETKLPDMHPWQKIGETNDGPGLAILGATIARVMAIDRRGAGRVLSEAIIEELKQTPTAAGKEPHLVQQMEDIRKATYTLHIETNPGDKFYRPEIRGSSHLKRIKPFPRGNWEAVPSKGYFHPSLDIGDQMGSALTLAIDSRTDQINFVTDSNGLPLDASQISNEEIPPENRRTLEYGVERPNGMRALGLWNLGLQVMELKHLPGVFSYEHISQLGETTNALYMATLARVAMRALTNPQNEYAGRAGEGLVSALKVLNKSDSSSAPDRNQLVLAGKLFGASVSVDGSAAD